MRHNDVRNFQIAKGNTSLPGSISEWEPPDSISNSEVKTLSADGSVGSPHVRVGHRQAFIKKNHFLIGNGFFLTQNSLRIYKIKLMRTKI